MIKTLFGNYFINVALLSWILAQVIKTLIPLFRGLGTSWSRLVGAGGMPSAHSALVCSLAAGSFLQYGWKSSAFAFALALALIVMYDASGVRRSAGQQAKLLNEINRYLQQLPPESGLPAFAGRETSLQESLGHRPWEVACGAVLGVAVAVFVHFV